MSLSRFRDAFSRCGILTASTRSYALVAAFNFLSTSCQYQALRVRAVFRSLSSTQPECSRTFYVRLQYVSYTTQSLGALPSREKVSKSRN